MPQFFPKKENSAQPEGRKAGEVVGEMQYRIGREVVEDYLAALDEFKSPGPVELHPRIFPEVISEPLAIIFENSWRTGEIPTDWRRANVVPILKKREIIITSSV